MADLEDVVDVINELEGTVQELKHAVESRPKTAHTVAAVVCAMVLVLVVEGWIADMWNSKFVLSLRYAVSTEQVTIEEKPHDCDFMRAPLGSKGCSYVREIMTTKTGTNSTGQHFVTYDSGKTWSRIDDPSQVKTGVYVTWEKK